MSQKTEQDSRPIAEAVDLPEISVEHSTEFLTGSAPCAGVSRPLPAAWLGQRGIYRSRLEAVCNGEQLVDPLTLGELIQHAWRYLYLTRRAGLGLKPARQPLTSTTKTPEATDAAVDQMIAEEDADIRQNLTQQAEAERPEVVAWRYGFSGGIVSDKACLDEWKSGGEYQSLMTVVQHERIAGALRFERQQMDRAFTACINELDAALAKLAELEKQEPAATVAKVPGEDWNSLDFHFDLQGMLPGTKLYTTPVAQAQHSVPEEFIGRLSEFLAQRGATGKALLRELRAMLAAEPGKEVPQAWIDVQAERRRQITAEGWTPEHDDAHSHGEMARAAACYALAGSSAPNDGTAALLVSLAWPWDEQWWKPSTARRDMVKACALALAEIECLDRAAASQGGPSDA